MITKRVHVMFKTIFICTLLYISFYIFLVTTKNFGTLNILITNYEVCKGPRRLDCGIETFKINSNYYSLALKIRVKENVVLTNGKVVGSSNGREIVKYQMQKPCNNLLLNSLLQSYMNITSKCMILKGNYEFTVDIKGISQKYYNGVYMYGNWSFKTVLYGNNCNVVCNILDLSLTPKGN